MNIVVYICIADIHSNTLLLHCKNVRVILTLSGLAQLHLFRGFYSVKM